MPTIDELRGRFSDKERETWEIDRILIEEPDDRDASRRRFAIDLRAGYSATAIQMGGGSAVLGPARTPVIELLRALDGKLDGAAIERAALWGAALGNDRLIEILAMEWFAGVRLLDLGNNRLTKKGLAPLFASDAGRKLRCLILSFNRVGNAIQSISGLTELTHLDLLYCNISGKALVKLGKADLPALTHLDLRAVTGSATPNKLIMASKMGDELEPITIVADDLSKFLATPLARRLERLNLGQIDLDAAATSAIAAAELPGLESLALGYTRFGPRALQALAGGDGLVALTGLDLGDVIYSPEEQDDEADSAFAALGQASFAARLESLILGRSINADCLSGLLESPLPALRELGMANALLGDEGCRVLAAAELPLTHLRLPGNGVGPEGIAALLDSRFAGELVQLDLRHNLLRDEGCELIAGSEKLGALERLAIGQTGATDRTVAALVRGPVLERLTCLDLSDNRISDDAALLLAEARPPSLRELLLAKCGLTERGIAALRGLELPLLDVADQDPSSLPPRLADCPELTIEMLDRVPSREPDPPLPPAFREIYPDRFSWAGVGSNRDWVGVLERTGRVVMVEIASKRVVEPEPPIEERRFDFEISPDGRWCGLISHHSGLFVVDTASGASTRLGDALGHQKARVCWCGDRLVVLDCDTDGDWEGRLEVYGLDAGGAWRREHQLGGFWRARDTLTVIAGGRIVAVSGDSCGAFLVAVRGPELRYLGQLASRSLRVFEAEGRSYIVTQWRHGYEIDNIDAALDAAFTRGESPERLDLGEETWPRY